MAGSEGAAGGVEGAGDVASFNGPKHVAADGSGNIYVADTMNGRIQVFQYAPGEGML